MTAGRLEDKVAVVTGALGSIGRATVERLRTEGACVVAVDVAEEGKLDEDDRCILVRADVADPNAVNAFVDMAVERFGRLDIMFNNAGIEGPIAPLARYDDKAFEQLWRVNVLGTFLGIKAAARHMVSAGAGVIINTASITGAGSALHQIGYGATKHAVIGMTRTAALELAPTGVRVNAVAPGPVDTPMMSRVEEGFSRKHPDAVRTDIQKAIPVGRYASPDDVAAVVAFLASDDATYVTGSVYGVDGGWMVR